MPDPIYIHAVDLIEAEVGGEIVLLHTGNWQYFEFDRTGGAIWKLLKTPMSLDELVTQLTARFEVTPACCARDVDAFLAESVSNGLLVVRGV